MTLAPHAPAGADLKHHELVARLNLTAHARSASGDLRLRGTAAVYDTETEIVPGLYEILDQGAFRDVLDRSGTDVRLYWSHDRSQPLARQSAGNLELRETSRGLEFAATLPATQLARDAVTLVESGVVREMSFAFRLAEQDHTLERHAGGVRRRIHRVTDLLEISLVTEPAYPGTNVQARGALDAIRHRRHVSVRTFDVYGPDSKYSWFRDAVVDAEASTRTERMRQSGDGYIADIESVVDSPFEHPLHGDLEQARARLATVREERAMSSTGLDWMLAGEVPGFISSAFAVAARSRAVVAGLLNTSEPLPKDLTVSIPRLTGGALVGVQTAQGQTIVTQDPTSGMASSPVATIAGQVDVQQQVFDLSRNYDTAISTELGSAIAEQLDLQVLTGIGADGQFLGLLNIAGIAQATYTDASPTYGEAATPLGQLASLVSTARGRIPTALVMHTRRNFWAASAVDSQGRPMVTPDPDDDTAARGDGRVGSHVGVPAYATPAVPTNLGAGTQDVILALVGPDIYLLTSGIRTMFLVEPGSATLTVKVVARRYAALVAPQPSAIGRLDGTGLTAPAGF